MVDDNHEADAPRWVRRGSIILVAYEGNRGPSVARNTGAAHYTGTPIDWFYFTDTGCSRERDFFMRLVDARASARFDCVAMAAPVHGVTVSAAQTPINDYMTVEGILNPPMDVDGPQAIVTANAAVCASAFRTAGGFDASYPSRLAKTLTLASNFGCSGRSTGRDTPQSVTDSLSPQTTLRADSCGTERGPRTSNTG